MEEYLFRIDMASDNDQFMESHRELVSCLYGGIDLRVGANWVPDFVRAIIDDDGQISLTIIELEARGVSARISGRKYLAEDPNALLKAFDSYLGRVIENCRSSADPRETVFRSLRDRIQGSDSVTIYAAGALRKSMDYIEKHPLLYQMTGKLMVHEEKKVTSSVSALILNNKLSAKEVKWLFRTIAILDAVVRRRDHSKATYRAWRAQEKSQPLKYFLRRNEAEYPDLSEFTFSPKKQGAEVPIQSVLSDLTRLWSAHLGRPIEVSAVRDLVESYSPESLGVQGHHRMQDVFEVARAVVANNNI